MMFRNRQSLWNKQRVTPPPLRTYPNRSLWPSNYSSVPFGSILIYSLSQLQSPQLQKAEYPSNWNSWRRWVKQRAGYRCQMCRRSLPESELDAHHITPLAQGGPINSENLVCLCRRCHSMFHSRMWNRYVREHPWESQSYHFY